MPDPIAPRPPADDTASAAKLALTLALAMVPEPLAQAAAFGRWWLDPSSAQIVLSLEAASFISVSVGWHVNLTTCLTYVLSEDVPILRAAVACRPSAPLDCEFRVANSSDGVRWLRLLELPPDQHRIGLATTGILVDITAAKHAAMREQFNFASTQLLVGTHTLGEAINKVIKLVCSNLGWDCGMYWSVDASAVSAPCLVCAHYWSATALPAAEAFVNLGRDGYPSRIATGQGLVGQVWHSGEPRWIEDGNDDPACPFPPYALESGMHSGYAFPVAYESDNGSRHKPGVLLFFSRLARQRSAQLPNLSAAIGGLIAQTSQRIAQQEDIRQLAQIDVLSGLANRRHFHDLLAAACRNAAERGVVMGMLYIDLDRFKPINDALGHEVGDAVLRQFALRLADLTPADGCAGRVGGDEFALFLYPGNALERLQEVAEGILQAARTPFMVGGRELAISASVGISVFPDNGLSGAELLRHADSAMYRVKGNGRNGVSFFSQANADDAQLALAQELTLEAELLHALAQQQLFLEYQPVFSPHDRQVRAVEALIRWRHPDGSIVSPSRFIPIAEKSHLIVDIGRWAVRQACADLPFLQGSGLPNLRLNVNMAALEFSNVNLPDELSAIIAEYAIEARHLCLELTESMMMKHAEQVIPVMQALRQRGFQISIDDFGMGYSSLSRLKDLPISSVKIDQSFIQRLPDALADRAIVQTIIDIGRNMDLEVVAEGVETEAQLQHLRNVGCNLVQGYLLGRPMPLERLIATFGTPAPAKNAA